MTQKLPVVRIGDRVKIITSKFIKRIGYPLIWTDIADEVRVDPRTMQAYRLLTGQKPEDSAKQSLQFLLKSKLPTDEIPNDLVRAIARMRVEEMNFGGNERQIIYKTTRADKAGLWWDTDNECADYTGQVLEVIGKRLAKTGTRFPPTSGRGSYDEEDWYEDGGLENCKTHIILKTDAGEIERINVELHTRKPKVK